MSSTRSLRSQNKQSNDLIEKIDPKIETEKSNKPVTRKKESKKVTAKDSNKENENETKTVEQQQEQAKERPKRFTKSSSISKLDPASGDDKLNSNKNQKSKNISNCSSNDSFLATTATKTTTITSTVNTTKPRTRSQPRTNETENLSSQSTKITRPVRNVAKRNEALVENKENKIEDNQLTKNFASIDINENVNAKQPTKSSSKKLPIPPSIKINLPDLDVKNGKEDANDDLISQNNVKKSAKLLDINEKDEVLNLCCDNKTKYTKSTSTPSGMRRKPLKPPQDISFIGKPE